MRYHILFEAAEGLDQFMSNQLICFTSNLQWSLGTRHVWHGKATLLHCVLV
jgi:hypothetical protein